MVLGVWDPDWKNFWEVTNLAEFVWSSASLLCCICLWILWNVVPNIKRTPGKMAFRASVCEGIASLGFIFMYIVNTGSRCVAYGGAQYTMLWCVLALIILFEIGANLWRLLMYVHLFHIYRNPFQPERHRTLYRVLVVVVSAIATLWLGARFSVPVNPKNCRGETRMLDESYFRMLMYGFFVLPFILFTVLGCTLCGLVRWLVKLQAQRHSDSQIACFAQQRVYRHCVAYLLAHSSLLTFGCVGVTISLSWPGLIMSNRVQEQILVALTCGRPCFSFLGWLAVNDVIFKLFGVCSCGRRPTTPVGGSRVSSPSRRPRHGSRGESVDGRAPGASEAMAQRAEHHQGIQPGFKKELRFELLHDVITSIGSSARGHACGSLDPSHSRSSRSSELGGIAPLLLDGGLPSREMSREASCEAAHDVTCRQAAGVPDAGTPPRLTVPGASTPPRGAMPSRQMSPSLRGVPAHGARAVDVRRQLSSPQSTFSRTRHSTYGSQGSEGPSRHSVAEDFRTIRNCLHVTDEDYASAFPTQTPSTDVDVGWKERLRESVSEGASGSFFYRVMGADAGAMSHFIVKQITKAEKDVLMDIRVPYRNYLLEWSAAAGAAQGGTARTRYPSLIQYFGCHSVPLRWKGSGKVCFVVMRNFLPVAPWLVFDLKGATANRRALSPECLHKIHAGCPGGKYGTLRDWEWMDIGMGVDISEEDKADLDETIRRDAQFLSSQNILDYSLLIGIHRLDRPDGRRPITPASTVADHDRRLRELQQAGGYVSIDRQKVYFFGIIDVLERYTLAWQAQHVVLSAAYRYACKNSAADGMSAMAPDAYADRFYTFVHYEVLQLGQDFGQTPSAQDCQTPSRRWPFGVFVPSDSDAVDNCTPLRNEVAGIRAPACGPFSRPLALGAGGSTGRLADVTFALPEDGPVVTCCSCFSKCRHRACAGRSCHLASCCRRLLCQRRSRPQGLERWRHLWMRRRRGLVRDRIDCAQEHYTRRLRELEAQTEELRRENALLRAVAVGGRCAELNTGNGVPRLPSGRTGVSDSGALAPAIDNGGVTGRTSSATAMRSCSFLTVDSESF